ncbi:hypothetical protein M5689_023526 [Euphorbia peplus]|nr:hypothetical protein M5689_023526 [Euphorbia peplus]
MFRILGSLARYSMSRGFEKDLVRRSKVKPGYIRIGCDYSYRSGEGRMGGWAFDCSENLIFFYQELRKEREQLKDKDTEITNSPVKSEAGIY